MTTICLFETKTEKKKREEYDLICQDYLNNSKYIMSKELKPNRVMSYIAEKHGRSVMSIKNILKKRGIYKNPAEPVSVNSITQ
jgi:hypothetical protein